VSWMNGLDRYRPILSQLSMARPLEYKSVTCGISVDKRGIPDAVAGSLKLCSAILVYFDQCYFQIQYLIDAIRPCMQHVPPLGALRSVFRSICM
jgi:hypothetical protein